MIEIDKPLEDMTLEEVNKLLNEIYRLQFEAIGRRQLLEAPPPLGVIVSDGIGTRERVG